MKLLTTKLVSKIKEAMEKCNAVMGICAMDLTTDEVPIVMNGDEVFPIGSSIKIPILIEFFKKVEAGALDPNKKLVFLKENLVGGSGVIQYLTPGELTMPLLDYATLMINVSDNVATNILIDLVGMEDVNLTLAGLGLKVTKLQRKMIDWNAAKEGKENISTPKEAIQLMNALHTRNILSEYICENTMKILKKPKLGVIRDSVPVEVEVADKSGGVEGVSCDIGIVLLPNRPFAVAIMTKHIPKADLGNLEVGASMKNIARMIFEYFEELSLATVYGRRTTLI